MEEKEASINRLTSNFDYAALVADVLWRNEKARKELLNDQQVLKAMKEDPALFAVLMLRLPSGAFKPLPFQIDFLEIKVNELLFAVGVKSAKPPWQRQKLISLQLCILTQLF